MLAASWPGCHIPDLLLALSMEVDAFNAARHLIKADIVEALETCAAYCPDSVIRHKEILFPAHEEMLLVHPVLGHQLGARQVLGQRLISRESSPMLAVNLLVGAPFRMLCNERVLASDDFTLKVRGQAGMILG